MKNYYHILGLSFESKPENSLIYAAYKALVKLYHPDIFKGNNKDLKRKITEIKELKSKSLESICSSRGNIIAAIEMNKGWFRENNIEPGVKVLLP